MALAGAISTAVLLAGDLAEMRWWAFTAAGVGSGLLVVIAEAPARARAAQNPERVLRLFAVPLGLLVTLTRPATRWVPLSSEAVFPSSAGQTQGGGPLVEARRLRQMLISPEGPQGLEEDERKMIRAILALNQTTVKEIMVPRTDFTAISTEATLPEVVQLLVESGRSRIPLYEGTIDNVVGVLYAKDVLNAVNSPAEPFALRPIAREPYFHPRVQEGPAPSSGVPG